MLTHSTAQPQSRTHHPQNKLKASVTITNIQTHPRPVSARHPTSDSCNLTTSIVEPATPACGQTTSAQSGHNEWRTTLACYSLLSTLQDLPLMIFPLICFCSVIVVWFSCKLLRW